MPKEVEAVVLEKTALNCLCTLNVHVRKADWFFKRKMCLKETKKKSYFCTEKSKSVRTVESIPVLVIGVTH